MLTKSKIKKKTEYTVFLETVTITADITAIVEKVKMKIFVKYKKCILNQKSEILVWEKN